jgi:hypothetical protein
MTMTDLSCPRTASAPPAERGFTVLDMIAMAVAVMCAMRPGMMDFIAPTA